MVGWVTAWVKWLGGSGGQTGGWVTGWVKRVVNKRIQNSL